MCKRSKRVRLTASTQTRAGDVSAPAQSRRFIISEKRWLVSSARSLTSSREQGERVTSCSLCHGMESDVRVASSMALATGARSASSACL